MSPVLYTLLGAPSKSDQFGEHAATHKTALNMTTAGPRNESTTVMNDIHRANFVWPEDPVDEMPVK